MSQIEFLLVDAVCDLHGGKKKPATQMEKMALRRGYLVMEDLLGVYVLTAKAETLLVKHGDSYQIAGVVLDRDNHLKVIAQEKRDAEEEAQRQADKAGWGTW